MKFTRFVGGRLASDFCAQLCLVCWRSDFYNELKDGVVAAILAQIAAHRNGESIDAGLLKSATHSFGVSDALV
jgi:hypothetical protein